jgi:hypothetical protein
MAHRPQQQTLSVRIGEPLRRRLERTRQLTAAKTGHPVSLSEIAKQFLESAHGDHLEVVDLLADPTQSLRRIRRKGEAGLSLSRAEWTTVAHFVSHGAEASPAQTSNRVSRDSLLAILDVFLTLYDLCTDHQPRLDTYLGNLPSESRPTMSRLGLAGSKLSDAVRHAVAEARRLVNDPAMTWQPLLAARNVYVLLDEDALPGGEDLTRALRPYWPVLWRLSARGHFVEANEPVRDPSTAREGLYQSPIPALTEGAYTLSFGRGAGPEFSALLNLPAPRGARYPIPTYPRLSEFRAMLAALAGDNRPGSWTGAYFAADVTTTQTTEESKIWFRAHDNGIAFAFSLDEWMTLHALFRRAWETPDIRRAWDALALEYGEL